MKSIKTAYLFIVITIFFPLYCPDTNWATYEERIEIVNINSSIPENLLVLNKYLSDKSDILNQFKVKQKLLTMSYEEILDFEKILASENKNKKLKKIVNEIINRFENNNIFNFIEEIMIDNIPSKLESPFYPDEPGKMHLNKIGAHTERLYLYNLRLDYRDNNISKVSDILWVGSSIEKKQKKKTSKVIKGKEANGTGFAEISKKKWLFKLPEDNQVNFMLNERAFRKLNKRFNENPIRPVYVGNKIILRNENRAFCLDSSTGRELWTYSANKSGHEYYTTYSHKNINSFGYEFLLNENVMYSQLGNKLVALKIGRVEPELLWEKDLGEYTIAMSPVHYMGKLVVGLINSRGEIWICGFDPKDGVLIWNKYLGITSSDSQPSDIAVVSEGNVIFGNNYGFVVCINADKGDIVWIKKVNNRKYDVIDYWQEKKYMNQFRDKGMIEYDNHFMHVSGEGNLYYKPRESEYLNIINPANGETVEEIYIDSKKYVLLGATDRSLAVLKRSVKNKSQKILELDQKSGTIQSGIKVNEGKIKGVLNISPEEIFLKIGERLHKVQLDQDGMDVQSKSVGIPGWLIDYNSEQFFIASGREMTLLGPPANGVESDNSIVFDQRDRIKNKLVKWLTKSDAHMSTEYDFIIKQIKEMNIPINDVVEIIDENIEIVQRYTDSKAFIKLKKVFGEEIFRYKDINIRLKNYLLEKGLIAKSRNKIIRKRRAYSKEDYSFKKNRTYGIPITVVEGAQNLDFFIFLSLDQVVCADEEGNVRWAKNVAIRPSRWFGSKRMDIKAYLYGDVLIISELKNIIAVDVHNGDLIWSMANHDINDKYEIVSWWNGTDILLGRHKDRLIALKGREICVINPKTGYKSAVREINSYTPIGLHVRNNRIYVLSKKNEKGHILVLDMKLNILNETGLDCNPDNITKISWDVFHGVVFIAESPDIACYDIDTGEVIEKFNVKTSFEDIYFESLHGDVLIYIPFIKLLKVNISNKIIKNQWTLELKSEGLGRYLFTKKPDKSYYILGNTIICPVRMGESYYMAACDLVTGKTLWQKQLANAGGVFMSLSNYINYDNNYLYFILSTGLENCDFIDKIDLKHLSSYIRIDVFTRIYKLNINTNQVELYKEYPSINDLVYVEPSLIKTDNYLIRTINSNLLEAEYKIDGR